MATIGQYETKHGRRWEVRYLKPDGSSTRKRGFQRRRDAELWAAEHVTQAKADGGYVNPSDGRATIGQLYETWRDAHMPLWKESMADTIDSRWRTHVRPAWAGISVNKVTSADLQAWASDLTARRSASVVLASAGILKGILADAVRDRRIARNPMDDVTLPSKPRRKTERVYLSIPQLMRLADECGNGMHLGEMRRAMVLLLGFCGLRWGEMCALRVRDVDIARRRIMVRSNLVRVGSRWVEGTPKSGGERSVPMPQVVADAIVTLLAGRDGGERVFHDPSGEPPRLQSVSVNPNNRTWYVSAVRRAGVPLVSPHDLRHTAASIAVHAGANVKALQRMLGHATASMTLDVYADLFDEDLDAVAARVDMAVSTECPNEKCVQNVSKTVRHDS